MAKPTEKTQKKARENVRSLIDSFQTNCARLEEIADTCERENRGPSDEESAEIKTIERENSVLSMKISALQGGHLRTDPAPDYDRIVREQLLENNRKVNIQLVREIGTSADLEDADLIRVERMDMIKPIREGLIWDKVGIKIMFNCPMGKLLWPKHTKAKAWFVKEGAAITGSKINYDALNCKPERMGVAVPVTREEIEMSDGLVEKVTREEMPEAVTDLVNEALFTTSSTYTYTEGETTKTADRSVYGPFVEAAKTPVEFAADVPTRAELLKMKSQVVGSGLKILAPCWVMSENMKAELENVKVDAGSGRFVCEEDKIFGYPVFTTAAIGEGVGFGDWSYQAAAFFGSMGVAADPYTLLRQNAVDFVLNGHFQTVTLAKEAFAYGKKKATAGK